MARIDYYFSILSPFTYLAGDGLERVAGKHGAEISYRPCDIMKVFAETGGVPVPQRHPSRQEYRLQELKRISKKRGLRLNLKPAHWPTDPFPGSAAIIATQLYGGNAGAVAQSLLTACWAEDKDVANPAVVAEALAMEGLDAASLVTELAQARKVFEENTAAALANGVFGSPFYVVGGERFWGQDRLEYLDDHLAALG